MSLRGVEGGLTPGLPPWACAAWLAARGWRNHVLALPKSKIAPNHPCGGLHRQPVPRASCRFIISAPWWRLR